MKIFCITKKGGGNQLNFTHFSLANKASRIKIQKLNQVFRHFNIIKPWVKVTVFISK